MEDARVAGTGCCCRPVTRSGGRDDAVGDGAAARGSTTECCVEVARSRVAGAEVVAAEGGDDSAGEGVVGDDDDDSAGEGVSVEGTAGRGDDGDDMGAGEGVGVVPLGMGEFRLGMGADAWGRGENEDEVGAMDDDADRWRWCSR